MKKTVAIALLTIFALPLFAANDAMLSYYQRQAVTQGRNAKQDRMFASALARDVASWVRTNETSPEIKTALLMQADYHLRAQEYAQALLAVYQVRFYFPSTQDISLLSSHIETIMDKLNRGQKAEALKLLAVDTSGIEALDGRKATLLISLVRSQLEDIYEPVCALFEDFFEQYPQYTQTDKILLMYGDWHRQNNNFLAAVLEYQKVYELYPGTVYKAASLRMTADVYASNLKEYEMAANLYEQVLKQYPDSAERGTVYKHLAMMQENRKEYESALAYYDKAIKELAGQPTVAEAWQGKADVLAKTKQYRAAYNTLLQGAETVSSAEASYVAMLSQAAEVANRRLKEPALETAALEKILLAYPQTHQAPKFMYEAAIAYEKQEKQPKAIELYKRIIIHYPTDKYAGKAQSRLGRLERD